MTGIQAQCFRWLLTEKPALSMLMSSPAKALVGLANFCLMLGISPAMPLGSNNVTNTNSPPRANRPSFGHDGV